LTDYTLSYKNDINARKTIKSMEMNKEEHEQLIASALGLDSSGPIAPAPIGRAPPPPPPTTMDEFAKTRLECKNQLLDGMNYQLLDMSIDNFNLTIKREEEINKSLKNKKIRLSNFPSHISENIAKFAIYKKYGVMPNWDTDKGDLILKTVFRTMRLEVKGSINLSNGPPTFGPTEIWDRIYFVDGVDGKDKKYKVYEIKLSNDSHTWQNIKVNKKQTYYDQCLEKRRPRLTFSEIKSQVGHLCEVIFEGHISELNYGV